MFTNIWFFMFEFIGKEPWFVLFADFYSVNTLNMTKFPKVEEDVHNRVSWANSKQLQLTIEPSLP